MRGPHFVSVRSVLLFVFITLALLPAAAQQEAVPARVTEAVDNTRLVTLHGNVHPLARAEYDNGLAPDSQPMQRMLLVLQRSSEQEAALRKLLDEQQIKSSPNYHKWLTPAQFGLEFGPADADVQAITDWLGSEGFQDIHVSAGRTTIEFSGTAGLVRQAFHTELHKYVVNGEAHWANATDPEIPAALAPVVAGFTSLNNFRPKPLHEILGPFTKSKTTGEVRPLFTLTVNGKTYHPVGPTDFATIYNISSLWQAGTDGTGQTIAVVGDSNINPQDVANFRSMFGLPPNPPNVILNGPDPGLVPGAETEADLDVEWSGAVAKNATIDLVVSEDTEADLGFNLSALYAVDNNLAPVLNESFGICELDMDAGGNAFYSNLWEQAAAQGITVTVAAGDSGSAGCDYKESETAAEGGLAVNGIASTPFDLAVGGTDFNDVNDSSQYWNSTNNPTTQSSAKSYIPEAIWNESCARDGLTTDCTTVSTDGSDLVAAGGGPSNCTASSNGVCSGGYIKPSWQNGPGVPNDGARDTPDVSLFASAGFNGSFFVVCENDAEGVYGGANCDLNAPYVDFLAIGGTSASAPAFAGIMALVNQQDGQRQGDANYILYKLAAQPNASCTSNTASVTNSSCIFYDVVTGNNSVACIGAKPNCSSQSGQSYGIMVVDPSSNPQVPAWTTSAGYDLASGLGSVNAANFVKNWNSVSFSPTSTTLSISPTTLTHGQPVNVNIDVTSSSGTPTGAVSLTGGPTGNPGITAFTLTNGSFSGTTNMLPGGTYNVTAHYAGDGTFGGSNSTPPVQVTVSKENSQTSVGLVTFDYWTGAITSTDATTAPYGSPYIVRADVTNSSGQRCSSNPVPCPTGQVTLTDNGKSLDLGTYALNSAGYTEDQPIQLLAGVNSISATYSGDSSYNPSTSNPVPVSITSAPTTLSTVGGAEGEPTVGAPLTLYTTVNTESSGIAPTGTFTFYEGSTQLTGSLTLTPTVASPSGPASLEAAFQTSLPLSGNQTITAVYSGDSNYKGSTSPGTADDPRYAETFNIRASSTAVSPGTNVTLTALVDTTNKNLTPTGTITFLGAMGVIPGPVTLTPITDSNGNSALQATLIYTPSATDVIDAEYTGDINYFPAKTVQVTVTVETPDFSLSSNFTSNMVTAGSAATYTISVTSSYGFASFVTLGCAVAAQTATQYMPICALTPASVTPGQNPASATLTVSTTKRSFSPPGPPSGRRHPGIPLALYFAFGMMLAGWLCFARSGRRRLLTGATLAVLILVLFMGVASCGGGTVSGGGGGGATQTGTPAGAYTVTVTGTSGNLSHTVQVSLTVQ